MSVATWKPWPAPCGETAAADCPYGLWLRYPKAELPGVVRFGTDRLGRQRFRCKTCRRTFFAPPASDGHQLGFKAYRRVEVHLARSGPAREPHHLIAARLGITTRTSEKWDEEWTAATEAGQAPLVPQDADLGRGRLARCTQRLDLGPYTVASVDEPTFIAASIGEMRHFVKRREFERRQEFLRTLDALSDASLPIRERRDRLRRLGDSIAQLFHDQLGLKIVR